MGRPKKKIVSKYMPTTQEINAMAYCVHNGVMIYPVLCGPNKFILNVKIDRNGLKRKIQSPKEYQQHELVEPTYKIYLKYFLQIANEDMIKKSKKNYIKF